MHKIIPIFTAATLLLTPATVFANGTDPHAPEEEHSAAERREDGVSPVAVGGFVVLLAAGVGFFVFTRMKNKGGNIQNTNTQ